MTSIRKEFRVVCGDGYPLVVHAFEPETPIRRTALIAAATAVRCRFYFDFAEYLASRGLTVVTWDWRGVGENRRGSLRGFDADMSDWAKLDLPAVIDWATARYAQPMVAVGHSFGGQAFGLADRAGRFERLLLVATQSGYWRHWPLPDRYLFRTALTVLPALAQLLGYLPARALGQGEDLPKNVALEWLGWCRSPDYLGDWDGHRRIRAPVYSIGTSDDGYAPEAARRWLLDRYGGEQKIFVTVDPREHGIGRIGHFGFFRKRLAAPLWVEPVEWLRG